MDLYTVDIGPWWYSVNVPRHRNDTPKSAVPHYHMDRYVSAPPAICCAPLSHGQICLCSSRNLLCPIITWTDMSLLLPQSAVPHYHMDRYVSAPPAICCAPLSHGQICLCSSRNLLCPIITWTDMSLLLPAHAEPRRLASSDGNQSHGSR